MPSTHGGLRPKSSPAEGSTCCRRMASTVLLDLSLHGLPLSPATITLLFSLLCTVLLVCGFPNRSFRKGTKLPPSPPRLPFIGNLHQLMGSPPHQSLRNLSHEYGPLMLLQLGQVPAVVVSSAETAEEVLKRHDLAFASRPRLRAATALSGGKGIGFSPYGEYWRQARRLCAVHLLSPYRVQAFRPAREEEVARLVGEISALSSSGDAVDVSRALSSFTNSLICRAAVGKSVMEGGTAGGMTELVARSLAAVAGFQVMENFFPSLAWLSKFAGRDAEVSGLARRWRAVLHRVVEEAAGGRQDRTADGGFLDVLLSLEREATAAAFVPSREEIGGILVSLINAGTETSYLVLEGALKELIRNPTAMKKAQDEVREAAKGKPMVREDDITHMFYLKAVIKEVLRLHPPAPLLLPRESMQTVHVHGYEIPTKVWVVINAWAIARDPKYWVSPEEFQPERFLNSSTDFKGNDFQFIPFGAGRRICPGMQFAVATIELVLANLLYHFNWSLPKGMSEKNIDMDGSAGHKRASLLLMVKPNSLPSR